MKYLYAQPNDSIESVLQSFQKGVRHAVVAERQAKDEKELLEAYFIRRQLKATVRQLFRLE